MSTSSPRSDFVLILDFGSQYTQLIARRIRESHVYCEIHPCNAPFDEIRALGPQAIVLSGGPASVYEPKARPPSTAASSSSWGFPSSASATACSSSRTCSAGGSSARRRASTAPPKVRIDEPVGIFLRLRRGRDARGVDEPRRPHRGLPTGFRADRHQRQHAALRDRRRSPRRSTASSFTPRSAHTPRGGEILAAFLFEVARPLADVDARLRSPKKRSSSCAKRSGPTERAICGLSGGVDSSVAAVLCHQALGDRLTCIFVDNGALARRAKPSRSCTTFRDDFHLNLVARRCARAVPRPRCEGVTDPEQKRKIIGGIFIEVFQEEAAKVEEREVPRAGHALSRRDRERLVQGPERRHQEPPQRRRAARAHEARAHRAAARALQGRGARGAATRSGMPRDVLWRQPFPGPGLAVRCLGEVTRGAARGRSARADAIFDEEIRASGLYESLWQSFACSCRCARSASWATSAPTTRPSRSARSTRSDGMTADWARLPHELLGAISSAHHQRGARRQPRRLRHLVEAARPRSSGSKHVARGSQLLAALAIALPLLRSVDRGVPVCRLRPADHVAARERQRGRRPGHHR